MPRCKRASPHPKQRTGRNRAFRQLVDAVRGTKHFHLQRLGCEGHLSVSQALGRIEKERPSLSTHIDLLDALVRTSQKKRVLQTGRALDR